MNKILNYRFVILIIAMIFGIFYSVPSLLQTEKGAKVSLGLDLQGGLYMLLGVKTEEAVKSKVKSIASSVKYFGEAEDILIDEIRINDYSTTFTVLDSDEIPKIDKMLSKISGLNISKDGENYEISFTQEEIKSIKNYAIDQAVDTIRNRLDQFGLAEPNVARQGLEDILVELPGIKTAEDEKRARELISKPANLQMMAIDEARSARVNTLSNYEASEYGDVILPDAKIPDIKHLVQEIPILDGQKIIDAKVAFDQNNQPIISFTLNSEGANIFGDFTANNVGNHLAIVLDGKVYSAPVIRERIGGGSGQISGGFSMEEAHNVAIALRSGALPAPLVLLEKRSVGPSLGADSIQASMTALIGGFILVVLFMTIYYKMAGVVSNIALIANLFLILAVMALFGATLTLPGMAGIVLTVGMAVDANVIINERIRELIKEGASIPKAIENGYKNAMRAILDANITTLIAAVILYAYGTGAIKGFAITMSIGILASMLTAILGTHGIYEALLGKMKNKKIWFGVNKK